MVAFSLVFKWFLGAVFMWFGHLRVSCLFFGPFGVVMLCFLLTSKNPVPGSTPLDFTFFLLGLLGAEHCAGMFGQTLLGCFHVVLSGSIITVFSSVVIGFPYLLLTGQRWGW